MNPEGSCQIRLRLLHVRGSSRAVEPSVSREMTTTACQNAALSLPYRSARRRDGIWAHAPAVEPRKGVDSSLRRSSDVPDPEDSKLWGRSKIIQRRDAWLASNPARAKLPQSTSLSILQAATPPSALSWSADIPFKCYMCSASFKYSSDLSRHQVLHSRAKDPTRASGDSVYESAQEIAHHGNGQNLLIVREQITPPIFAHSSFTISEVDGKAIPEAPRNKAGNACLSVLSGEGWAGQEDAQQFSGGHLQLMGQTIKKGASTLPNAESSPPSSVEVDIYSSDEETDWDDDSEDSFAEYSTSYFRLVSDPAGKTNNQDSFVELTLSPAKQAVVDRLMKEFWAIFNAGARVATWVSFCFHSTHILIFLLAAQLEQISLSLQIIRHHRIPAVRMEETPHNLPPHHSHVRSRILRHHGILASAQATRNRREVKMTEIRKTMMEEIPKDAELCYYHHWTLRTGRSLLVPIESTSLTSIVAIPNSGDHVQ